MILPVKLDIRKPYYTVPYNAPFSNSSYPSKTAYETLASILIYTDVEKDDIESFRFVNGKLEIIFRQLEDRFSSTINSLVIPTDESEQIFTSSNLIIRTFLSEEDIDAIKAFNTLFSLEEGFIEAHLVKEKVA